MKTIWNEEAGNYEEISTFFDDFKRVFLIFCFLLKQKWNFYFGYKRERYKRNLINPFEFLSEHFWGVKVIYSLVLSYIAVFIFIFILGLIGWGISFIRIDNWFISFIKTITAGFLPSNLITELEIDGILLIPVFLLGFIGEVYEIIRLFIKSFFNRNSWELGTIIKSILVLGVAILLDLIKYGEIEYRWPHLLKPSSLPSIVHFFLVNGITCITLIIICFIVIHNILEIIESYRFRRERKGIISRKIIKKYKMRHFDFDE